MNKSTMTPFLAKKSFWGKAPTAEQLAKSELEQISMKLLHYQNEEALARLQVVYLEERKTQLQGQLNAGYFSDHSSPKVTPKIDFSK